MSVNVTIEIGKHTTPIPDGLKEMITDILGLAGFSGNITVRIGEFVPGGPHQQGIANANVGVEKDKVTVWLRIQSEGNDTSCKVRFGPQSGLSAEATREKIQRVIDDFGHETLEDRENGIRTQLELAKERRRGAEKSKVDLAAERKEPDARFTELDAHVKQLRAELLAAETELGPLRKEQETFGRRTGGIEIELLEVNELEQRLTSRLDEIQRKKVQEQAQPEIEALAARLGVDVAFLLANLKQSNDTKK